MGIDLDKIVSMESRKATRKRRKGTRGASPRYPRVVAPSGRHIAPARLLSILGAYGEPEGLAWAVLKALKIPVERKNAQGVVVQRGITQGTFNMRFGAGEVEYYWPKSQQVLGKDADGNAAVVCNSECKKDCQYVLAIAKLVRDGKKLADLHRELGLVLFVPGEGATDD